MLKISIITINLNNKEGLKKTIDSVINQTFYDKVEYIVIDGQSTDGSAELLEEYKDKLSKLLIEEDRGIYSAMNKGIDMATGDYTIFLNSGDYFHGRKMIDSMYPYLQEGTDIVYGDLCIHKTNGEQFTKRYVSAIPKDYFTYEALPHEAAFVKTELYKQKHLDENYQIISDTIFFHEAINVDGKSYKHIPLTLTDFFLGGKSSDTVNLKDEKKRYFNGLDIFICTHKDFTPPVSSCTYIVIDSHDIKPNLPLGDDFYSELYHFKFVNDSFPLRKYVGFCHYRRYFDFINNIPSMETLFKDGECVITKPLTFMTSLRTQYAQYHNIEDLVIIEDIIKEKFLDYYEVTEKYLNGNRFIPCNMFIMRTEDFREYCDFVFPVLQEYLNRVGTDIKARVENNKEKYFKKFYPNDQLDYQMRIGAFLAERLTGVFICKKFKKLKTVGMKITEDKYGKK